MKPQPYKDIAKLIRQPQTPVETIRTVVKRFHRARKVRGRKPGWRKTTPAEDACQVPAELVRRSGVNGADLLQLSEQELCTDVLLTPLAARKVAAARDAFLSC